VSPRGRVAAYAGFSVPAGLLTPPVTAFVGFSVPAGLLTPPVAAFVDFSVPAGLLTPPVAAFVGFSEPAGLLIPPGELLLATTGLIWPLGGSFSAGGVGHVMNYIHKKKNSIVNNCELY